MNTMTIGEASDYVLIAAFKCCRGKQEAENLHQEVFERLIRAGHLTETHVLGNKAYLKKTLASALVDGKRKQGAAFRGGGLAELSLPEDVDVLAGSLFGDPSAAMLAASDADALARACQYLKPQHKEVVGLFLRGHTTTEIAQILGEAESTVRSRFRSAAGEMRVHLFGTSAGERA